MYTLRFPFTLPPGREIQGSGTFELDGLTFSLKKQDRFYVFIIEGFPAEELAERYINNVWAGLMWVLLYRGLSPNMVLELGKVIYAQDPYQAAQNYGFKGRVDGFIDGGQPAIYPTGKRIVVETAEPMTPLQTYWAGDVLDIFREGIIFPKSAEVINDKKLQVGLELWGAYFTETSENARFLALVMALEALATGTPRTQLALNLQDKWVKEIDELQKTIDPKSADAVSLEALKKDLRSRREDSIRHQIRTLVLTTLQANGDKDANAMAEKAVKVYDERGKLVHGGKLKPHVLREATSDAKNIVERVLRALFLQRANPVGMSYIREGKPGLNPEDQGL